MGYLAVYFAIPWVFIYFLYKFLYMMKSEYFTTMWDERNHKASEMNHPNCIKDDWCWRIGLKGSTYTKTRQFQIKGCKWWKLLVYQKSVMSNQHTILHFFDQSKTVTSCLKSFHLLYSADITPFDSPFIPVFIEFS